MTKLPDGTNLTQVSSTTSKFVDAFSNGRAFAAGGESLNNLNWLVVRNTGTMTPTLNNGSFAVNMGMTPNAELLLVGNHTCTVPQDMSVAMQLSQRIAGNEVRFGYVQVESTTSGVPIPNTNLANFFANYCCTRLDGTTSTTAVAEAIEDSQAAFKAVSFTLPASSATLQDYSIECRVDDVTFASQLSDSTAARGPTPGRLSSVVPNHEMLYRPFIWLRNTSTAPASNTIATFVRISSSDIQEMKTEVIGRGSVTSSQAVPVGIVSGANGVVVTGMNATSGSNGASTHKLISAATTNAVTVKAAAGRIVAGSVANLSTEVRFFKVYNKASTPTVGTDVPILTIPLFPGQTNMLAFLADAIGQSLTVGISYAITGGLVDTDTTAIGAGDVVVALVTA